MTQPTLGNPQKTIEVLQKYGFSFQKKFGQNFLKDEALLLEIVNESGIKQNEVAVEIGAGKGALTSAIIKTAKKLYSFEIDSDLFEYLSKKFENQNVEFIFQDVMTMSDEALNSIVGDEFRLIANLPYYITSPILTKFLQNPNIKSATVMVQEEVADRIIAQPRTKDYGVLSIICQLFGEPKKVLRVNRNMFYPVPNVDSAVVHIERKKCEIKNVNKFIDFIKKAFSMKRKKLSSNLELLGLKKQFIETTLQNMGFQSTARAEELSVEDFKKLFDYIYELN